MIKDRFNRINDAVRHFRIELYCFLYFLATHMVNLPLKQLILDKECLNDYRLAADSCDSLGLTETKVNSEIQSTLVTLTIYQHLLSILPSILLTLVLAHWIDQRLDHLRYILALPCIGGAILNIFLTVQCINFNAEPMDTIYPFLFTGISGGEILVITGAYTFITKTTDSKYRSLRFIILEAVSSIAFPVANFLSKKLLSLTPWIYGQYRNYIGVFLVSGSILSFTEFWILITLLTRQSSQSNLQSRRQSRKVSQVSAYSYYKSLHAAKSRRVTAFSLQMPGPSGRRESSISHGRRTSVATLLMGFSMMNKPQGHLIASMGTLTEDGLDTRRPSAISQANRNSPTSPADFTLSQVLHYKNIIMTLKAFIRSRVNHGRAQLICLTISMIFVFFTLNSAPLIGETITRKIFNWTELHADDINDIKTIGTSIGSVLVMYTLVNLLNLDDTIVTMIGIVSLCVSLLIKGLYAHAIGFYLSSTIEILFDLTLAGFRSLVAQIVYNFETAKIYAIIASLMTLIHPIVIYVFAKLIPTIVQTQSNVLILSLCVTLVIPFKTIIYVGLSQRHSAAKRKSFCTVQVTPSPLPGPSTLFELSVPKDNQERRKSNRF